MTERAIAARVARLRAADPKLPYGKARARATRELQREPLPRLRGRFVR